jgi:hypothetical protein
VDEARKVAMAVPPKLLAVLQQEIDRSGPEGAVAVCQEQAPVMARNASASRAGWGMRRVSLRNRNPKAVPDAWERAALQDFDRRVAAHEPPARLERAEVTQGKRRGRAALHPRPAHRRHVPAVPRHARTA